MEINKALNGTELTMKLTGRLDTNTSPQLDAELDGLDNVTKLIMDMEGLNYISSAGLRVLLRAQGVMDKKKGTNKEGMVVKNLRPEVKDIFDLTGFSEILACE